MARRQDAAKLAAHLKEQIAKMERLEKAFTLRNSLWEFLKAAWEAIEPATPFVPGWHLEAICSHLQAVSQGQIKNLLVNMPPRHCKSIAVAVAWPCWEWTVRPQTRWMFSSYAQSLSIRDSVKCRRLLDSPWYQGLFGDVFKLSEDQNAKVRFDNDKGGYRLATSVGGATTGEGGDIIVCDDPHNVKEAESDTIREATILWWDQAMSTRLNNPRTGRKVIVMQRVHEGDLSGHVLEQGGYDHLCFPAQFEGTKKYTSIGWTDPRENVGDLLWPEQFDEATIDGLKVQLGSYATAGQLQQRPSPGEGGMLKRHWWKYWQHQGMNLGPVRVKFPNGEFQDVQPVYLPDMQERLQSWDLAFKHTTESDFVVGQCWGRRGANRYLLDQTRARMDAPETIKAIREMTRLHPAATLKLVEDKANGPAVIAILRQEIPGLVEVNPEGGKKSRAAAVAPIIEAGNVYLPHPKLASWVDDFIDECAGFPLAKFDDSVDSMSQGLTRWMGNVGQPKDRQRNILNPGYGSAVIRSDYGGDRGWMT